jgi:hypothetical protein
VQGGGDFDKVWEWIYGFLDVGKARFGFHRDILYVFEQLEKQQT